MLRKPLGGYPNSSSPPPLRTGRDKDKFDDSEYPENSPYFDKSNKKVIGKFKDEVSGMPINEFIGLRSKIYSHLKDTDEGGKTA